MEYIIVQAGGKGTRLGHLTQNKPKALLPVENLPMLFHLFRKYPDRRFIIIADYQKEVLREYLAAFADVKYQIVDAEGTGTCAGIRQALSLIPDRQPFMLNLWLLTFVKDSTLANEIQNRIILDLKHEGDLWNIMPNNSTTMNLIVLQGLVMVTAKRLGLDIGDFKRNHPGGHIGVMLQGK